MIVGRRHHQRILLTDIPRRHRAQRHRTAARGNQVFEFIADLDRNQIHPPAGLDNPPRALARHRAAADDEAAPTGEIYGVAVNTS